MATSAKSAAKSSGVFKHVQSTTTRCYGIDGYQCKVCSQSSERERELQRLNRNDDNPGTITTRANIRREAPSSATGRMNMAR